MKVVLAGCNDIRLAKLAREVAGHRHGMLSAYEMLNRKLPKNGQPKISKVGLELVEYFNRSFKTKILDSGIFSLAIGSARGEYSEDFLDQWQECLIRWIQATGYDGYAVEVDTQKITGTKQAWRLRQELRDQLKNPQINVWHIVDGKKGLDRLIEFADYLAFSVVELRNAKVPKLAEYVARQAAYIKNKKPDIKIHLLGCTTADVMARCKWCDTCDSSTWLSSGRYGQGFHTRNGKSEGVGIDQFRKHSHLVAEKVREKIRPWCRKDQSLRYYEIQAVELIEQIHTYRRFAGNQE